MRGQPCSSGRKLASVGTLRRASSILGSERPASDHSVDASIWVRWSNGRHLAARLRGGGGAAISGPKDAATLNWMVLCTPCRRRFGAMEVRMTRSRWINALMTVVVLGPVAVVATLGADALGAGETSLTLSPKALEEIAQVEAEIDRIEAQALERLGAPPDNQVQQIELLGKLMLYDKHLSVNRNEACAFCHMPETGFTGPVSELNRTTGSYPGSVRTRFSERKPQSHAYAPLSPVLHYNPGQGDLVGGNFWDMRATGRRLGNPAAEQAQGPPTNPVEMGLADIACAVYRASQRPYRALFERVWGPQAFAVAWPNDVEQVCARPGPPSAGDLTPVHLGELDRGRVGATFDQMAQAIAMYEASAEVTAFTSKFDAVLANKAQLTPQEKAGYDVFRGKRNAIPVTAMAGPAKTRCSPTLPRAISGRRPI